MLIINNVAELIDKGQVFTKNEIKCQGMMTKGAVQHADSCDPE